MNQERANEIYYWVVRTINEHVEPISEDRLLRLAQKQGIMRNELLEVVAASLSAGRLYQPIKNHLAHVKAY